MKNINISALAFGFFLAATIMPAIASNIVPILPSKFQEVAVKQTELSDVNENPLGTVQNLVGFTVLNTSLMLTFTLTEKFADGTSKELKNYSTDVPELTCFPALASSDYVNMPVVENGSSPGTFPVRVCNYAIDPRATQVIISYGLGTCTLNKSPITSGDYGIFGSIYDGFNADCKVVDASDTLIATAINGTYSPKST